MSESRVYDLSRASAAFYSRWARYYVFGLAMAIVLLSLPYTTSVTLQAFRGHVPSQGTLMVYLAIWGAVYPAMGFGFWESIVAMSPRPVRMTLTDDSIRLETRKGRRSEIYWTRPRFRLVLIDQSAYSTRTRGDASLGFRIGGFPAFRAVLTREAFEALLAEAKSRGLSVTSGRPSRWSAEAATPGTVIYRVRCDHPAGTT